MLSIEITVSDQPHLSYCIWCLTAVQVIFLGFKLAEIGIIHEWSWWWAFAPSWGTVALAILLMAGGWMLNSFTQFARWKSRRRDFGRQLEGDD